MSRYRLQPRALDSDSRAGVGSRKERRLLMLSRRLRLRFWVHEVRMPKEKRHIARAERRADMAKAREERLNNLGRAEGEAHHSRAADFHRSEH